jgi:oligosaccharide repeat unit polymerase
MQGRLRVKTLVVGALVFLASFAFLGITMGKGGDPYASWRDNVSSIGESLLVYAEGPIPAFNQVVRKDEPLEYGKNTFLGPLNVFRKLAGRPLASPIQEEVDVPFPTNVFTGIHPVYRDFGLVGVILAFAAIGAASTHFYVRGLAGDPLYIFYYSLGLFPLLFMVFSDQYFVPMVIWGMYGLAAYLYFRTRKGKAVTVEST